jgi:chemotaxis protein MotB
LERAGRIFPGAKMVQMSIRRFAQLALVLPILSSTACGYSQEEWDQKVRENESLRTELGNERQAHNKCKADYSSANQEIDNLKKQLTERGISLDSLNQSLAEQRKALEEYARRTEQLDAIKKRFELLSSKLQKLVQLGLKVEVRNNRMLIQLPGDVLFDSGREKLKQEGEKILLQIAEVVRTDADLSKRRFQVAGHTDAKPLVGGQFKDNWGLSAMRARSVLILLTTPTDAGGGGLSPSNWSAAGYADTDPVSTNDTDEGRQKNRRVELVVQPDVAEMLNLQSLTK